MVSPVCKKGEEENAVGWTGTFGPDCKDLQYQIRNLEVVGTKEVWSGEVVLSQVGSTLGRQSQGITPLLAAVREIACALA